jgi:uncharacterized membrane protein YgcG
MARKAKTLGIVERLKKAFLTWNANRLLAIEKQKALEAKQAAREQAQVAKERAQQEIAEAKAAARQAKLDREEKLHHKQMVKKAKAFVNRKHLKRVRRDDTPCYVNKHGDIVNYAILAYLLGDAFGQVSREDYAPSTSYYHSSDDDSSSSYSSSSSSWSSSSSDSGSSFGGFGGGDSGGGGASGSW